jgi:hypothetical protein
MKIVLGGVFLSFVAAAVAGAQRDPLQGTWVLNTTKSTATNPMPKAETQVYDIADGMEHCVADFTSADGSNRKSDYHAKRNDGEWHLVKSTGPQSSSVMIVKLDASRTVRFNKRADGSVGLALRAVSKDGKTFTWTTINGDGKVTGQYLFERQ